MQLSDQPIGSRVRVSAVNGVDEISVRLMEMGVIPGTELTVIGHAPLGDPIELELRGYHLSVRRREADRIAVEQLA